MAIDPTGYKAALATIQPGQLSERQQRIAAGLAMIRDGKTIQAASRATSIPWTTLDRYKRGVSSLEANETGAEVHVDAISNAAADIALMASQAVLESMRDNLEEWKPSDLIKAFGVASDKVIALGGRTAAPASGMQELVSALLDQADVTLKRRDPVAEAVEVEVIG